MNKSRWKSKSFYASILIAIGAVGRWMNGDIPIEQMITFVGGALGLFGVRDALK